MDVDGDGKRVKCKYCEKIVNGCIYRFKKLLACTRIDVESCNNVLQEVKTTILQLLCEAKCASSKR